MTGPEAKPLGALVRTHRLAAGLSQEELAERAHLSWRTISDIERGITTAPYRDTLDEADSDPTRFWRYLLTALDRAAPGVAAAALTMLRSSDAPSMEAVLGALVNGAAEQARDIILILDDYHLIEAASIHRMLAFL